MLTEIENGYQDDDGYFVTEYDTNWQVTAIYRNTDDTDGKVAVAVYDGETIVAYTYTDDDGVSFTYDVAVNGDVTGYTIKWTETDESGSYSYAYNYSATGEFLGYSYSDGTKTVSYDADDQFVSSTIDAGSLTDEGDGTYSYTDEFGVKTIFGDSLGTQITGYITHYEWENGSETTEYDADWNMISISITEGSITTTYDSNWNVVGTATDLSALTGETEGEFTVYTETNEWGGETKYYVDGNGDMVKFTETYSGSYSYINWNGDEVTSSYENAYTYDAAGSLLSESNISTDTNGGTHSYEVTYQNDGSYTVTDTWSDEYGEGSSSYAYDADGNEISGSNSGTHTYSYVDENGVEQTGTNSHSMTNNYDGDGVLIGYTTTNTWDGGEETTEYDADWNMVSTSITEGSKTTTYDSNWNVTGTSTDFDGQSGETEGEFTVYTETDNWGGETKYYVNGSGELVKYTETYSGSHSYTDWNGNEVTATYENSYTYDADGNVLSESGTSTDSNGATHSHEVTYQDDGSYTVTDTWSDAYGEGSSSYAYDADGNEVSGSNSGTHTYSYIDENGVEQTGTSSHSMTNNYDGDGVLIGYTTTNTWDGGEETIEYDTDWNMVSTSITEGSKTTTYDSSWNVTGTSTDFDGQPGETEGEYTVYTETDNWGGETKYYVNGSGELVKYTETYSGSHSYTDWNGNEVTATYENSYTYDADGNVLSESGTSTDSNGATHSHEVTYQNDGSYTVTDTWSDAYGEGSSSYEYDADGNQISGSNSGEHTYSYIDENGVEQTGTNSYSMTDNYDGDGVLIGYTTTNIWDGGEETTEYDADWTMISTSITEGSKTTTYDANWNITGTSTNFDGQASEVEGEYTVYTETDNWGGETKYYVDGDGNLVKYTETHSGSWSQTDWNGDEVTSTYENSYTYDAAGILLSESGTSTDSNGGTHSHEVTYQNDGSYTVTDTWSDASGEGSSSYEYDADGNQISGSNSGEHTYSYIDENGVEQTSTNSYSMTDNYDGDGVLIGYTTTNTWDGGEETTEYDADWIMISTSITEGSKTTTYDANWNIIGTSTNFDGQASETEGEYTVYTETDNWGGETKYYVDGDGNLVKYTETHSGSWTDTDWNGDEVTSTYENSYTYDATGSLLGESNTSTDSNGSSHSYEATYQDDGSYTVTDTWSDANGEGSSSYGYDADGNQISGSNSGTNSYTYIDENGVEQTGTSIYSTTSNYDENGVLIGYTTTDEWSDSYGSGSRTYEYDANWNLISESGDGVGGDTGFDGPGTETRIDQFAEDGTTLTGYTIIQEGADDSGSFTSTSEYDAEDNLISRMEEGTHSYVDESGVTVTETFSAVTMPNYDGSGAIIGYTTTEDWTDAEGSGTTTYEYDAVWNLISDSGDVGGEEISEGTGSEIRTDHFAEDGTTLIGYTIVNEWLDTNGSFISTSEYDAEGNLISRVEDETESYVDGNGELVIETIHKVTTANFDESGILTGYSSVEDFSEAFGTGTLVSEYDAEWNMLSGVYNYVDENGVAQSGTSIETKTDHYAEDGITVTGYTMLEEWSGTDGSGTDTSVYDADWNLISEIESAVDENGDAQNSYGFYQPSESHVIDGPTFDGMQGDSIELEFVVENVNAPVTGSVSESSMIEDINALVTVQGSGFDITVAGDVSAAIVTADVGDLSGSTWIAIDADANDSFDANDYLIEITGATLTDFNTDVFV